MSKAAIITGGTRGIGAACVRRLAKMGYDVLFTYVSESSVALAEKIVEEVTAEYGVKCVSFRADVKSFEQCADTVEHAKDAFGAENIKVLVNNAGMNNHDLFVNLTEDGYTEDVKSDLFGTMHMCHSTLPLMMASGGGCIVNMSSIAALVPVSRAAAYSAAKAGVHGFSRAIAYEYGEYGIRSNCIAPGCIETDLLRNASDEEIEAVKKKSPLYMIGEPDDIADAMEYLINASYVTGQVLSPNGGYPMH